MKSKSLIILILLLTVLLPGIEGRAQDDSGKWSLQECIDYALRQNTDIRRSDLTASQNSVNLLEAKAGILPSVSGSVRQNLGWANQTDQSSGTETFTGTNSSSYYIGSSITLFSGFKLKNNIKKAEVDLEKSQYDQDEIKEYVTVSILEAYLNILYAEEQVNNSKEQLEATKEQLFLAEERLAVGMISQSDYLQVKTELSSEELTLANAESQLAMAKVSLMQLMELPVDDNFDIIRPDLDGYVMQNLDSDPREIYNAALLIKPEIKSAELAVSSSELNVDIARSSYMPELSLAAGLSSSYLGGSGSSQYASQLGSNINPTVGLTLSIPVYSNRQTKSGVETAKIDKQNAELEKISTSNELRKEIEQVCVDVNSSEIEYTASYNQHLSTLESYEVATEKYNQGMMNSVDYLFEKANLIEAESELLQAKYNMIYNYKMLDFYTGIPITL